MKKRRSKASISQKVPAKPDSREVSPSQLPDHMVAVVEEVSQAHRVVTALHVVGRVFLLIIIRVEHLSVFIIILIIILVFKNSLCSEG